MELPAPNVVSFFRHGPAAPGTLLPRRAPLFSSRPARGEIRGGGILDDTLSHDKRILAQFFRVSVVLAVLKCL